MHMRAELAGLSYTPLHRPGKPRAGGGFHPPRGSTAARPLLFVCFWGQGAWALGDQGDVGHMDCVHGCIYI